MQTHSSCARGERPKLSGGCGVCAPPLTGTGEFQAGLWGTARGRGRCAGREWVPGKSGYGRHRRPADPCAALRPSELKEAEIEIALG